MVDSAPADRRTKLPDVDTRGLLYPSVAYDEATKSPVYRLSELMFGSLLAAYVLGFISSGQHAPMSPDQLLPGWVKLVTDDLPYLSISVTFAYATAGLYLNYHAALLTMPTMPLERLPLDFGLALFEAVAFGFSIRYPVLFPGALGLTFLFAAWRQHQEHRVLVNKFADRYALVTKKDKGRDLADKEARDRFADAFVRKLRRKNTDKVDGFEELSGWSGSSWLAIVGGVAGIAASAAAYIPLGEGHLSSLASVNGLSVAAGLLVTLLSQSTLRKRAKFLFKDSDDEFVKMDQQFAQLHSELAVAFPNTQLAAKIDKVNN